MAAKTPAAFPTTGAVDITREMYAIQGASTVVTLTSGSKIDRTRLIEEIYYFADIDDADTWASGITGIQACFWQPDDVDVDACGASATAAGLITFDTAGGADVNGWLLLKIDPTTSGRGGLQQR